MENEHLDAVVTDLIDNIRGTFLGDVEWMVIDVAVRELIMNWNIYNKYNLISTETEMNNWIAMGE